MNANINYQKELDKIIMDIQEKNIIPTLLLHSCCAPCSSYVLEYLSKYFKITVLYFNPNITDGNEYTKRVEEQKRFIQEFKTVNPVDFIEGEYDTKKFFDFAKDLAGEPEGGKRCFDCYRFRLLETLRVAKEKGFDYFATTLTVSPYKNASKINEIGIELAQNMDVNYLVSDFKKKNGYKRSIELSKEYNLYRQDYCGCIYSKRDRAN